MKGPDLRGFSFSREEALELQNADLQKFCKHHYPKTTKNYIDVVEFDYGLSYVLAAIFAPNKKRRLLLCLPMIPGCSPPERSSVKQWSPPILSLRGE
jgi:hypothetical protein